MSRLGCPGNDEERWLGGIGSDWSIDGDHVCDSNADFVADGECDILNPDLMCVCAGLQPADQEFQSLRASERNGLDDYGQYVAGLDCSGANLLAISKHFKTNHEGKSNSDSATPARHGQGSAALRSCGPSRPKGGVAADSTK